MANKTISLPLVLIEKAESVAHVTGATFSGLTRICLERYLEDVQNKKDHD